MKTLYLECNMGAAGDMLMAALLELLPEKDTFLHTMNSLGLPGLHIDCLPVQKCGILGSHIRVRVNGEEEHSHDVPEHPHGTHAHHHEEGEHHHEEGEHHSHAHDHEHPHQTVSHDHPHDHAHGEACAHTHDHAHSHHHFSYEDIKQVIRGLDLPEPVRKNALAVYTLIGTAESHAHGVPVDQIHFHEVGSLDAVADVVGCCLLFHLINADRIIASPVHVGSGSVRCAHGVLPVPAPATAHILSGVPIYGGAVRGELCTPTGAALLKQFVSGFGELPVMTICKIGYGMGTKEFEAANCVRAFLGECGSGSDEIWELSCNLDDMTGEALGCATELLLQSGALDVFCTPIQMKKSRPAVMLTCLCRPEQKEPLVRQMLAHTTTLGVREKRCSRSVLTTSIRTIETPYGPIRIKSAHGYGIQKVKPEFEDVFAAAKMHGLPFDMVWRKALLLAESE